MPGYLSNLKIDSDGKLYKNVPVEDRALDKDYRLLQYDRMFGENYKRE